MKRYITIVSWIVLILLSYPVNGHCLGVDVRGHVSSLFILRDTDGFQHGFLDENEGVQWRNELQFDLTLKPEYAGMPTYYLEKVFMSYRGAYDAIFELRDKYDNVREKSPDDFELGKDDLEWENDLREVFVDLVAEEGMTKVNLRLGRQIVRWGETDSFNVINVVNPNDNSYQMFFSDPDDLATPLWMARLNYNVTGVGIFNNLGFEFLAVPDIRPTQLAPLGNKDGFINVDAPYAFIMQGLYDGMAANGLAGIVRLKEDVPDDTWENMEYGMSLDFSIESLEGSLHYFVGHQDQGVINWTGFPTLYFEHPRQRTYGYSFNYFVAPLNGVIRGEGAYTDKMHLGYNPTGNPFAFPEIAKKTVIQNLLGFDKDLHPGWIGTTSALTSAFEIYWQHIQNLEVDENPAIYAADKKNTGIATVMFLTDYHHGTIKPRIMAGYDTEGSWMTNMNLAYDPDGKWMYQITQMSFWGNKTPLSRYSVGGVMQNNSELSFRIYYRF